jgi:hypothetical protein
MASPDRHFAAGALFTETAAPGTPNANDVWLYPKSDKKFYGKDDTGAEFPIGSGSKTLARFTPDNNQPPAANFATLDTRNSIAVLDFDDSTDESAIFVSICPEGADLASGLKIRLVWAATTATSGSTVWEVALERMNTDIDSDSFDTAAGTAFATNGTSGVPNYSEITLATIDSLAVGDGFRLKVTRDADNGSDTMTGDAELIAVEVQQVA